MKDKEIERRFKEFVTTHKKDGIGTMVIPEVVIEEYGIIEELLPYVDIDRIFSKSMKDVMIVIASLGLRRYNGSFKFLHPHIEWDNVRDIFSEVYGDSFYDNKT